MSCGRIALERAGIKVENYFASEIDKHAIKVSASNYPDIKQVGDVQFLTAENFERYPIDLLIGGSPCQGFSFAGKQLNFDDPRSKLFFDFVSLLKSLKPKYFLLENVKMKKEYQAIISEHLGVEPIEINSALVSAQNRKRLYWTNIPNVGQPEDLGVLLKDVLEDESNEIGARRGRYLIDGKRGDHKVDSLSGKTEQRIEIRKDNKSNCLTTVEKDNVVIVTRSNNIQKLVKQINPSKDAGGKQPYMQDRVFHKEGKSHALTSSFAQRTNVGEFTDPKTKEKSGVIYRRLTPIECERLQTVPDNYTSSVSNTQRYKMLGNGWTVDVIAHIFKNIKG